MFCGCSSLKELNLKNFNTNNVTNMRDIFNGCSSLKELNLNNFNTNKVTNINVMLYKCSSLNELYLNNFNTVICELSGLTFYRANQKFFKCPNN